jgi:hypothetical protein
MKYAFIKRNKLVWPICVQCRVMRVSISGYHEHLARRVDIAQRRHLSDEVLLVHISAVYAENRGAYGWPRIWRQLRAQGIRVGKQRVQRLMQKHGIKARVSGVSVLRLRMDIGGRLGAGAERVLCLDVCGSGAGLAGRFGRALRRSDRLRAQHS